MSSDSEFPPIFPPMVPRIFPPAERFGNDSLNSLDKYSANVPRNTIKSRNSIWRQFMDFCQQRNYSIDSSTPTEKVAEIMKDYACNMRKSNGADYRPAVVKCMWNTTAKILQDLFHKNQQRDIDPFRDYAFKSARDARDAKRKLVSINVKVVQVSTEDLEELIDSLDENSPTGLQKKFYLVARQALSWRRDEAARCLVSYFTEEFTLEGKPTGRIQYNPRFLENRDVFRHDLGGGAKWLVKNNANVGRCPVRLLKKLLSKRIGITNERLFLTPNISRKDNCACPDPKWFKNNHVGKNEIGNWEKNLPRIKNPRSDARESRQEIQEELQTTTSSYCSQSEIKLEEISVTEPSVLESSFVDCKEEPLDDDSEESSFHMMECEPNVLPAHSLEEERDKPKPDDRDRLSSPVPNGRLRLVDLHYVLNWSLTVQYEHNRDKCDGKLRISKENCRGILTEITLACDSCSYEVTKSTENGENIAKLSAIEDALSKTRSLLNDLL